MTWTQATANAGWSARYCHASVVFNNNMWVMGGCNDNDSNFYNDVWYSSNGVNWTRATANAGWSARGVPSSVIFDNKMWVMGGMGGFDSTHHIPSDLRDDIWYSSNGVNWTQATADAEWSARAGHTSVVFDNKMWVMGGLDSSNCKNDVWYSTNGVNWTQATTNAGWSARFVHTSVVFNNKMWVMGGFDLNNCKNDVWYSSNGVNWTQATANAQWPARFGHTSVVFDNKMWVMGGEDNTSNRNDVWYSTDGVNWTQATANAGWSVRFVHTSVVFNNKMWVMGGGGGRGNDVWYSTGLGIEDNRQTLTTNRFSLNAEPNPFKTHVAIRYSLTATTKVTLSIYDISGKIVKTLVNENKKPGDYIVSWDGKDKNKRTVAKGVYFYTLNTKERREQKKLLMLK
jgi:hypothetical protein